MPSLAFQLKLDAQRLYTSIVAEDHILENKYIILRAKSDKMCLALEGLILSAQNQFSYLDGNIIFITNFRKNRPKFLVKVIILRVIFTKCRVRWLHCPLHEEGADF